MNKEKAEEVVVSSMVGIGLVLLVLIIFNVQMLPEIQAMEKFAVQFPYKLFQSLVDTIPTWIN